LEWQLGHPFDADDAAELTALIASDELKRHLVSVAGGFDTGN
jgi:hypothetical protein